MLKIKIGDFEKGRYYCEYCYSGRGQCIGKHTYDTGRGTKKFLNLIRRITKGGIDYIEEVMLYDASPEYMWEHIMYTLYVIFKNKRRA